MNPRDLSGFQPPAPKQPQFFIIRIKAGKADFILPSQNCMRNGNGDDIDDYLMFRDEVQKTLDDYAKHYGGVENFRVIKAEQQKFSVSVKLDF